MTDTPPLRRLNTNLLYALHVVLEMPTLTSAASRIGLTQPAMSMALRRLRDHFGDELILYGRSRRLTALGEALRPRVGRLLREIDDTFNLSLDFDPATARRTITLTAPEAIELMYLSRVVPRLMRAAPGIDVRLLPFSYGSVDRMLGEGADIAVVPQAMMDPDLCAQPLFEHDLTGMIWRDFPLAGDELSHEAYVHGRHAALFDEIEQPLFSGRMADPLVAQRQIVVRTAHYAMLAHLVVGTDLIVTTSSWLAQHYASIMPVRVVGLPIPRRPSILAAQWERHRDREPMIRWLVGLLTDCLDWRRDHQAA